MKVAVFHNYMDNIGGAEKVGLTLAKKFNADFYTTNIDKERVRKMGFKDINFISIGEVSVNSPFRQQKALWLFSKLNLGNKYDYYIIDGDWAVSGAVHNKPNLWYVHSPIREIWDTYEFVRNQVVPFWGKYFFDGWVYFNRTLNRKYIKQVNKIVCNSKNTKKRVKKYLERDAIVIYPPVDINKYYWKAPKNYWLSVNRLFKHKRVEMQIEAFRKLPKENLIIVGSYEKANHFQKYAAFLNSIKPNNVKISSWVSEKKLRELYAYCKGFITTSMDEDFGLTAVEAMASGKPVIAPNEGGYKESIIDNVTGKLIDNINPNNILNAIRVIGNNTNKYRKSCLKNSGDFNSRLFMRNIQNEIYDN